MTWQYQFPFLSQKQHHMILICQPLPQNTLTVVGARDIGKWLEILAECIKHIGMKAARHVCVLFTKENLLEKNKGKGITWEKDNYRSY